MRKANAPVRESAVVLLFSSASHEIARLENLFQIGGFVTLKVDSNQCQELIRWIVAIFCNEECVVQFRQQFFEKR